MFSVLIPSLFSFLKINGRHIYFGASQRRRKEFFKGERDENDIFQKGSSCTDLFPNTL